MPDDKSAAPTAAAQELVRAAHVLQCLNYSITGDVAMMVFQIRQQSAVDDPRFAITVPVGGLRALRTMVTDLIDAAEKKGINAGFASLHKPRDVVVGHSDHMRGCVMLQFNPAAEDESLWLLTDEVGIGVGEALVKDVMGRMTLAERRAHVMKQAKVLQTPQRRIILPGQG